MPDVIAIAWAIGLVLLVAVLLKQLLGGLGLERPLGAEQLPGPAGEAGVSHGEVDLSVPAAKQISLLVVTLPDYSTLCRDFPSDQVFALVDHYWIDVTEVVDRFKGEVAGLCGSEVFVAFGRILEVERPLLSAAGAGLEIVRQLKGPIAGVGPIGERCRGASAAVTFGPAFCGPVGKGWRRHYTSVGSVVDQVFTLARRAPPGEVLVPAELAEALSVEYCTGPASNAGPEVLRLTGPREAETR